MHAEGEFADVARAGVAIEDLVDMFGLRAGVGLDDFSFKEFQPDVVERNSLIDGGRVVGDHAFHGKDAKIMGVEYIISAKLFETLPADEKKLWHSHVHEVKSGQLIAPGVPEKAEHEFMEKIIGTYGKTWHTWHTDQKLTLPMGHPLLMMGFTADGQANQAMIDERDKRFKIASADKVKDRASIPAPAIAAGADAWQQGDVMQLSLQPLA
jgi:hypothetical protein